jgi:eukaryotic-like serine/threonine-protein kinase
MTQATIARPLKIGKYETLAELGRGATAVVYLADDTFNNRKIAIKVQVKDDSAGEEEARRFEKLFLNEAALVGKLSHPNIVGVFDAVVEGESRYIIMEYVSGGSLKKFCSETNLLPVRQAVLIIFKACRAMDYAFQNGVIHRDIKSANILLSDRDDIKISDFGTAQISHSTHTQIDGFVGSPAYMAPEQINEESPSAQTDIYSLGVVMYELLAGRLPYQASTSVAMINKILNEPPTPLISIRPDLPEKLVQIVETAIQQNVIPVGTRWRVTWRRLFRNWRNTPSRFLLPRNSMRCASWNFLKILKTLNCGKYCAARCGSTSLASKACCLKAMWAMRFLSSSQARSR